jgi:hypothetical protein
MDEEIGPVEKLLKFPLFEALAGRRSRRIAVGVSIPAGPLCHQSKMRPQRLSPLETRIVLCAVGGQTGWHHLMEYSTNHAHKLPSYASGAAGRTHPSAGAWFATRIFFTDDTGIFMLNDDAKRDFAKLLFEKQPEEAEGGGFATRIAPDRLYLPERFLASHNRQFANVAGSLLVLPVCDLAQVTLELIIMLVVGGSTVQDDIAGRQIPGAGQEQRLLDIGNAMPLSRLEQNALALASAEMGIACQNGMLALQAMGLGGWLYAGLNSLAVLGASGDPSVPGLGFMHQRNGEQQQPNCTGLPGIFEAHCPPCYANMAEAFEALMRRKFGVGGPFNADTDGPFRDNRAVRSSAYQLNEAQRGLVIKIAEYIYQAYGKFPASIPSMYLQTVLQAHHLDLDFYDAHIPGGYLHTHASHHADWHGADEE